MHPAQLEQELTSFARFFAKGVRKFGIRRIESKILELKSSENGSVKHRVQKILDETCSEFGLHLTHLLYSTRRGNVTRARVCAIVLLQKHCGLTQIQIADMFHKKPQIISERVRAYYRVSTQEGNDNKLFERSFDKLFSDSEYLLRIKSVEQKVIANIKTADGKEHN